MQYSAANARSVVGKFSHRQLSGECRKLVVTLVQRSEGISHLKLICLNLMHLSSADSRDVAAGSGEVSDNKEWFIILTR